MFNSTQHGYKDEQTSAAIIAVITAMGTVAVYVRHQLLNME